MIYRGICLLGLNSHLLIDCCHLDIGIIPLQLSRQDNCLGRAWSFLIIMEFILSNSCLRSGRKPCDLLCFPFHGICDWGTAN